MRKIAVSLSKGGVGKSSSSVTLAHGLALQKKRVLLIDTDDQGQCALLLGVKPAKGLAEVLNEEAAAKEALFEARSNLWILSGGKSLSGCKRSIGRKDFGAERTLADALAPLDKLFDYVIIDTAPSWDSLTINAMFYAQEVLTPVNMEALTLNSLAEFVKSLEAVKKFNTQLSHKYVLPTFHDGRVKKSSEVMEQLKKHFPDQLLEPIAYSARMSESAGYGQTIFEYAPKTPGARDYQKATKRIMKDE